MFYSTRAWFLSRLLSQKKLVIYLESFTAAYSHYGEGVMELAAAKKIVKQKCARPMLHARTLGFRHPVTGGGWRGGVGVASASSVPHSPHARSNRLDAAAQSPKPPMFDRMHRACISNAYAYISNVYATCTYQTYMPRVHLKRAHTERVLL